jgi:hypothetical protein
MLQCSGWYCADLATPSRSSRRGRRQPVPAECGRCAVCRAAAWVRCSADRWWTFAALAAEAEGHKLAASSGTASMPCLPTMLRAHTPTVSARLKRAPQLSNVLKHLNKTLAATCLCLSSCYCTRTFPNPFSATTPLTEIVRICQRPCLDPFKM